MSTDSSYDQAYKAGFNDGYGFGVSEERSVQSLGSLHSDLKRLKEDLIAQLIKIDTMLTRLEKANG